MNKENIIRAVVYLLTAIATAILIAFGLASCSAARTITTTATSYTSGDTCTTIQTKTIESYTGRKVN